MQFAQTARFKRLLVDHAMEPAQVFWRFVAGSMTDTATIAWCKVFGSYDESTHWTHAFQKDEHDAVRLGLWGAVKLSEQEWGAYRESLVEYRNQMGAHHDLDATVEKFPHFDTALVAADFMYGKLRARLKDEERGGLPESLERWAGTVAENNRAIVKHAFAGSAKLGSNMKRGYR